MEKLFQSRASTESGVIFLIVAVVQQCSEANDSATVEGMIVNAFDGVKIERERDRTRRM